MCVGVVWVWCTVVHVGSSDGEGSVHWEEDRDTHHCDGDGHLIWWAQESSTDLKEGSGGGAYQLFPSGSGWGGQ